MSAAKDFTDPEKGASPVGEPYDHDHGHEARARQASIVAASLIEDPARYGITQRGLKSRHAQMIALGGTIGTG